MILELIRDKDTGKETLGRLYADDQWLCYTIERPWIDNLARISCIPEGEYPLTTKKYGRFWDKYQLPIPILEDTAPRSEILIHPANWAKQLAGCIAVGSTQNENSVGNSVATWKNLLPIFKTCDKIVIKQFTSITERCL